MKPFLSLWRLWLALAMLPVGLVAPGVALVPVHRQGEGGPQFVGELDLESRLLCALAGLLPKASTERSELVRRAASLKGSLVARATAAIRNLS